MVKPPRPPRMVIQCSLPYSAWEGLGRLRERTGRPMSELVREAVEAYLAPQSEATARGE